MSAPTRESSNFTGRIKEMFDHLAPKYDLLNKINSFGLDRLWRKELVRRVAAEQPKLVLDLAAGTGDVSIALAKKLPGTTVVAADLSQKMLFHALYKALNEDLTEQVKIDVVDATDLPYEDDSFDAVTCSFGVRNFADIPKGFSEMHRVLKPGGICAILELCPPEPGLINSLYQIHAQAVIPSMARLFGSDTSAYDYLGDSIEEVPNRAVMEYLMQQAGFKNTYYREFFPGVCVLYIGYKGRFEDELERNKLHFIKLLAQDLEG